MSRWSAYGRPFPRATAGRALTTAGCMNAKLRAVADANGRPLSFLLTAEQVSDYTGAAALLDDLCG